MGTAVLTRQKAAYSSIPILLAVTYLHDQNGPPHFTPQFSSKHEWKTDHFSFSACIFPFNKVVCVQNHGNLGIVNNHYPEEFAKNLPRVLSIGWTNPYILSYRFYERRFLEKFLIYGAVIVLQNCPEIFLGFSWHVRWRLRGLPHPWGSSQLFQALRPLPGTASNLRLAKAV